MNAGSVTKYTGPHLPAEQVTETRELLSTLETQVAATIAKSSGLEYMDRSNLSELFREKGVASGDEFDPTSGALRGLLARLDYLVVIEASGPNTARLRAIDVETGAVKAVAVCESRSAIAQVFARQKTPECVLSFVEQTLGAARVRLAAKRERALRNARAKQQEAERLAEESRKKAEEQRRRERQISAEQEDARRQRDEEAQNRQHAENELAKIQPRYDEVFARASAEATFWRELEGELRTSGQSLRPQVHTLLGSVHSKLDQCRSFFTDLRPPDAKTCLDQVSKELDQLDSYK